MWILWDRDLHLALWGKEDLHDGMIDVNESALAMLGRIFLCAHDGLR